jgi:hypothetical protein
MDRFAAHYPEVEGGSMSNLIENLATDRHAERYPAASRPAASVRRGDAPRLATARSRVGWLLIGLGLRIAMRGGDSPARRASLLG